MAIKVTRVQVATTATKLLDPSEPAGRGGRRKAIHVINGGPNPIYVGPNNLVTTANGFMVPAGGSLLLEQGAAHGALYAVASTANQTSPGDTGILVEF
jgi:hypothetical protein